METRVTGSPRLVAQRSPSLLFLFSGVQVIIRCVSAESSTARWTACRSRSALSSFGELECAAEAAGLLQVRREELVLADVGIGNTSPGEAHSLLEAAGQGENSQYMQSSAMKAKGDLLLGRDLRYRVL